MSPDQPSPPAAPAARPPRRTGPPRTPGQKSARRRAREVAAQGLYEWLVGGADTGLIEAHMREQDGFGEADARHFSALLEGCIAEAAALDEVLGRHTDRRTQELSPVEHAVLLIGAYELRHCVDVPYRVAINEAVEVAKEFGGTDGHKFVNGVLDKAAAELRPQEFAARRAAPR